MIQMAPMLSHIRGRAHYYSRTSRMVLLMGICCVAFTLIIARLFYLQVMEYGTYSETAKEQHFGAITLPARRGEILMQDYHGSNLSKVATNTTLDLLYVDPLVVDDKVHIARQLAPFVFQEEEYEACRELPDECVYEVRQIAPAEVGIDVPEDSGAKEAAQPKEEAEEPEFYSYAEMVDRVSADILKKIVKMEVDFVLLKRNADQELMALVMNERLPGVFVDAEKFMIHGDPTMIPENRVRDVAKTLSGLLEIPVARLEQQLLRRKVRYVFLRNRLSPETSRKIRALELKGVVLLPEHWRFYPEGGLAANVIGFLNREGTGQYGMEGYHNAELEGKKGQIYAESDPFGRQITVGGESKIVRAVDGDNIVLTIDRVVQKKVEEVLAEAVPHFRADSGQIMIMDPFTGAIIAMANYPGFDPNQFGNAYTIRPLAKDEKVYPTTPLFKKDDKGRFVAIDEKTDLTDLNEDEVQKYIYENKVGPEAFRNKLVSDTYEPGSVFKPITMAIALDANEVEPQTTYIDDGPLKIDEFEIKNAEGRYFGKTTMTEVLARSLNTGTSFVAKKLGSQLFYNYIREFGFGQYTHIGLEGEVKGTVDFYKRWSKAQLLTTSFGQGIAVTPLQMVTAWAALANGGKLIQPHIVKSVKKGDQEIVTEPQIVKRVISEDTSSIITSMLVNAVSNGVGRPAAIDGYLVAGKTGTSQIAGRSGKYETGEGAFITSFAGYAPALDPKFVMLVKFDRPRIGENTYGSTTAAPTFKKIAEFLMDYYNIPPSG